jgi:hypothetical protein
VSCRTGCRTQDHASWGECARDARFHNAGVAQRDEYKKYDKELTDYESARKQGIQPSTTRRADIDKAVREANA